MSKRAALFALLCALVGLGASAAAAYIHYHLLYDPAYRSFCDVNATISCTQVYMSRFSTVRGMPVALFGATGSSPPRCSRSAALTARPAVRENVPGYLFVLSTLVARRRPVSGLRVVRPAEGRVPAVPDHVCRRDRAVPRVRCGHLISHDYIASPRRPAIVRVFAGSPLAIVVAILFFAGAASTLAWFPREGDGGARRSGGAGVAPAPTQDQTLGVRALVSRRSRACRWSCRRRREGADRQVQRLPVPGVRPVVPGLQADPREVRGASIPAQVKLVLKDYPLEPRVQRRASARRFTPAACEAAVAVRLARRTSKAEAMEEWLYTHQPAMTPPIGAPGGARRRADHRLRRQVRSRRSSSVKGDVALGRQLGDQVDADLLHQRREGRRRAAAAVSSIRRSPTSCSARSRRK